MADSRRPEEWILEGQGEPLPNLAKAEGQWISRNQMYLYRSGNPGAGSTSMAHALEREDGEWAQGFDADQLAQAFSLSIDGLLAVNRDGGLFVAIFSAVPSRGGAAATAYRFRIHEREVWITREAGLAEGRA